MHGRLRAAIGMAALALLGIGSAGAAHAAAPAFHCEASALRASGVGFATPIEPATVGRDGACAKLAATRPLDVGAVHASVLTAATTYDAAAPAGTATGGLADLSIGLTPGLIAQLPTLTDIDKIAPVPLTLPGALALLPPLSLDVLLDVRDAVRNAVSPLVPAAGTSLFSAGLVTARATVGCQSGTAQLASSSYVAGLSALGQPLPTSTAVDRTIDLVGAQQVALASLPPDHIHILAADGTPLDPVLVKPVTDAVAALLPTLPNTFSLPASPLQVSLTPGTQLREGDSLTRQALTAHVALAGVHLLDATIGEAKVAADAGTCATVRSASPGQKPVEEGAVDAVTAAGSVADQILACSDRKLVLMDVLRKGDMVKLLGAANRDYAGQRVAIRLRATNAVVAHAMVQKDGSFQTTAPLPPARFMTPAKRDLVRYSAEIGKERSLPLKLERRMIVSSMSSAGGKVTIAGRAVGPLTAPATTIRLMRRLSCKKVALVKEFKPRADGRFSVTVDAPAGQVAAVYRMTTFVRANRHNPKRFPTFTLPRGVALDAR
jgi:hypothetical protein